MVVEEKWLRGSLGRFVKQAFRYVVADEIES